jgi:hypothetical protein
MTEAHLPDMASILAEYPAGGGGPAPLHRCNEFAAVVVSHMIEATDVVSFRVALIGLEQWRGSLAWRFRASPDTEDEQERFMLHNFALVVCRPGDNLSASPLAILGRLCGAIIKHRRDGENYIHSLKPFRRLPAAVRAAAYAALGPGPLGSAAWGELQREVANEDAEYARWPARPSAAQPSRSGR